MITSAKQFIRSSDFSLILNKRRQNAKCSSVVADLKINTKEIALKLLSHLMCKLEHAIEVESSGKVYQRPYIF